MALQTTVLTSWWLLSNIPFSMFFGEVFPSFLNPDDALVFQISTEAMSAVEKTPNQSYVEDGVGTTGGNADGKF